MVICGTKNGSSLEEPFEEPFEAPFEAPLFLRVYINLLYRNKNHTVSKYIKKKIKSWLIKGNTTN